MRLECVDAMLVRWLRAGRRRALDESGGWQVHVRAAAPDESWIRRVVMRLAAQPARRRTLTRTEALALKRWGRTLDEESIIRAAPSTARARARTRTQLERIIARQPFAERTLLADQVARIFPADRDRVKRARHRPPSTRNALFVDAVAVLRADGGPLSTCCRQLAARICELFPREAFPELYNLPGRALSDEALKRVLAEQIRAACRTRKS